MTPAYPPSLVTDALLIGVDLGPNLSVTGSPATILWLIALKREGETCSAVQFLKIGAAAMPPALLLALGPLSSQAGSSRRRWPLRPKLQDWTSFSGLAGSGSSRS